MARANAIGDTIRARMLAWQARWPQIGDVRGLGAMLAIELVRDPARRSPLPSSPPPSSTRRSSAG